MIYNINTFMAQSHSKMAAITDDETFIKDKLVLYIKENDSWTKEPDDKPTLIKAIKQIAFKNIKLINEWVKENPGCQDPRTKQNVKYNKIVMNSMSGGTVEEQRDNIEQIVKNVTKAVVIDKYMEKYMEK